MVGQGIESCGCTHDSRGSDKDEGNKEEDTGQFPHNFSANEIAHIRDTVAASVVMTKLTLDLGAVGIEKLPAKHVDSA